MLEQRPIKVNILTSGRFHVCDLARELAAQGMDVKFYSFLPKRRTRRFGLENRFARSFFVPFGIFFAALRLVRSPSLVRRLDEAIRWLADWVYSLTMRRAEVVIAMSGLALQSARAAKRMGAMLWLERGSRHVLSQREILASIAARGPGAEFVTNATVARELEGYRLADVISIASMHVQASFAERGIAGVRLFRNPYGVDLALFTPRTAPPRARPCVVMVGTWCLRKGCDVLLEAWHALDARVPGGVELLHVGSVGDLALPTHERFHHHDPVVQHALPDFYARGDVAVLASREEGLAMVLAQALACGLPIVCTDRTGGADLEALMPGSGRVLCVPSDDAMALGEALHAALALGPAKDVEAFQRLRAALTWQAYGQRYAAEIRARLGKN